MLYCVQNLGQKQQTLKKIELILLLVPEQALKQQCQSVSECHPDGPPPVSLVLMKRMWVFLQKKKRSFDKPGVTFAARRNVFLKNHKGTNQSFVYEQPTP